MPYLSPDARNRAQKAGLCTERGTSAATPQLDLSAGKEDESE